MYDSQSQQYSNSSPVFSKDKNDYDEQPIFIRKNKKIDINQEIQSIFNQMIKQNPKCDYGMEFSTEIQSDIPMIQSKSRTFKEMKQVSKKRQNIPVIEWKKPEDQKQIVYSQAIFGIKNLHIKMRYEDRFPKSK